jgi:8-oxo-(d)GTP phosphatase
VEWVPIADATRLLTYPHDRATLREAIAARKTTYPLIVLRHSDARSRDTWRGAEPDRPLLASGRRQAERLVDVLDAYGVTTVISSPSARCRETVAPYADAADVPLETATLLSEEGADADATTALVVGLARELADRGPLVVCSHRPVLPLVFGALGLRKMSLDKGEMVVAHVRKGKVVAIERHLVR